MCVDTWTCATHGFVLHLIFLKREPSGHLYFFIDIVSPPQSLLEIAALSVAKLYHSATMVQGLQIPTELKPIIIAQLPQKMQKMELPREILFPFLFDDDDNDEDSHICCILHPVRGRADWVRQE